MFEDEHFDGDDGDARQVTSAHTASPEPESSAPEFAARKLPAANSQDRQRRTSAAQPTNLLGKLADPEFTEDSALALLTRGDLTPETLQLAAKNAVVLKSRKAKMALVSHPNTPRHVSVPLARQFFIFDLMKVALSPRMPADVKIAVDDLLISRLKTVTLGERLTLARRASGRVAAALLLDSETTVIAKGKIKTSNAESEARDSRVMRSALDNPRLTEALLINSVLRPSANAALINAVARHPKWSSRREVRAALLRAEYLSLARALEFGREIPASLLYELLASSRLPRKIKDQLLHEAEREHAPRKAAK